MKFCVILWISIIVEAMDCYIKPCLSPCCFIIKSLNLTESHYLFTCDIRNLYQLFCFLFDQSDGETLCSIPHDMQEEVANGFECHLFRQDSSPSLQQSFSHQYPNPALALLLVPFHWRCSRRTLLQQRWSQTSQRYGEGKKQRVSHPTWRRQRTRQTSWNRREAWHQRHW